MGRTMGGGRARGTAGAALLLATAMLLAAPAAAAAAAAGSGALRHSKHWGKAGEAWSPAGPIMDFSFAGYRQGSAPLPDPPVTRTVASFQKVGMSDTAALQSALAWAHKQPVTDEYIVLELPARKFLLTEALHIRRSRLILRGQGSSKTTLVVPKSLADIYGEHRQGGYIFFNAFVVFQGRVDTENMTTVTGRATRGDTRLTVSSTAGLEVGQIYILRWKDQDSLFVQYLFDYEVPPANKSTGSEAMSYPNRIVAIQGKTVTFERPIPYDIWPEAASVRLYSRAGNVTESGVEGLTFAFKWEPYNGHHLERGWNGIEFSGVYDCWARDIATINADSSVVMTDSSAVTVKGLSITVTKTRANLKRPQANYDGHWGVHHTQSQDVLLDGFDIQARLTHSVGAGSSGMFSVFTNGVMKDGNLELHRALAGPLLFTNIDVGVGSYATFSTGPRTSGPSSQSNTTYWNIRSFKPVEPPVNNGGWLGSCLYGPGMNLIGIRLKAALAKTMCKSWRYERDVNSPGNLYEAQLARRLQLAPATAPGARRQQQTRTGVRAS